MEPASSPIRAAAAIPPTYSAFMRSLPDILPIVPFTRPARGDVVIPGSKNPEHIKSNFDLFDFALTEDEMAQVAALNKNVRYYTSTPELLKKYAEMVPPVDEQK